MVVHVELPGQFVAPVATYQPTPQTSLFFYINDAISMKPFDGDQFIRQPKSVIVGQQLRPVSININHNHKSVRVGFQPGGLHRLLGVPMYEMIDDSYDAEDVFGADLKQLNERLPYAATAQEIKNLVESFLLSKLTTLKAASTLDIAMLALLKHGGNLSVEELASKSCLSIRQFERLCKQRIGLPPKLFARLVRFSRAYRMREEAPHISWTHIAHTCGYFDQMHFIRDFKEFSGTTPRIIDRQLQQIPVRLQEQMQL